MKARRVFSSLLVFFTLLLLAGNALAKDVQIPAPVGDIYVQDFAHVLNDNEKAELLNLGRSVEDQTTAQVAVLTVATIGDRTIEDFANEAFRQYGIGNKKENNGVLLVLAMKEHKVRIEVGYGLEGRIPDGKAGRILDDYAIPNLKNQQPNIAIIETYKVLANEVLAEYGKKGQQTPQPSSQGEKQGSSIPAWLIIIIVVVVVALDFKFFGGTLTYLLISILLRGGRGGGGGGSKGGGGGSSGGGGAGRGW
ncbi:TPM domain-containing protein [Neobacillus sp. PS3-40]|uniref:TPM domain-containing protein n=1 Tax=Neobacillus sp. PS3-40 TaxID=3070679 RepID=UPI0027E2116A|nr:TPM domain-containing protein [Neobacillus sp. PS3-40]WML43950.1 TPM domain-containing protein [Neobacillus sp. PS3-40]